MLFAAQFYATQIIVFQPNYCKKHIRRGLSYVLRISALIEY
jgi:hypothetical protein